MHLLTKFLLGTLLLLVGFNFNVLHANDFKVGDTVFVAYPAGNIKDDAFIVGQIKGIDQKGDYQISVLEYVEGHDYGLSCVPMVKDQSNKQSVSEYGAAWSVWQDTTVLETEKLDYVVSKNNVMKLGVGKHLFIERNNLYIVFGRWKSDAPMLTLDRIARAKQEASASQMRELLPALELVGLHRSSFYGEYERPYRPFETIKPLNHLLDAVIVLFKSDVALKRVWQARERDWSALSKNTRQYFLVEAIDKIVDDAKNQLYEDEVEKAGLQELKALKDKLSILQRVK